MEKLYFTKTGALFNWLKLPIYSYACLGCQAYRFFLTHICAPFLSEATLNLKTKKVRIYEAHLEQKISTDYYTFRKYLIQPTVNLPKSQVVKQERDIEKAKECADTIKHSISEIIENSSREERKVLASKLNLSSSSKNAVFSAFQSRIPSAEQLQHTPFDGVCGMMIAKFAADRFANKSWQEIAAKASKGATATTSGMQIVYNAFDISNTYDFVGTLKGVYATQVDNAEELHGGIYKISFATETSRHAILLSKEEGQDYILDPSIGLLRCSGAKTEELLKKIISKTTKRQDIDLKVFKFEHLSTDEGLKRALFEAK